MSRTMDDGRSCRPGRPGRASGVAGWLGGVVALGWALTLGGCEGAQAQGSAAIGEATPDGGLPSLSVVPRSPSPKVKIVFRTIPPTRATVSWGKKKLGAIAPRAPLVVDRPRDSGPLDVVVRAEGCLPVHTRAYTFTDSTVAVKVTPVDKKNTLFGYREAPPPEADGGVPPDAGGAFPSSLVP